jgi:membrane protein YdbS with pleckstrin-like domain
VDDVFAVPGAPWQPVSPRLVTLRRGLLAGTLAGVLIGLGILAWLWPDARPWLLAGAGGALLVGVLAWFLVTRSARSWAYAERDDDLLVRHGVMWLRLEVVPYGRMQLVDVSAGPLQRRAGIATVALRTASPDTQARIPGLEPAEAARLRDRLTERGEAQAAGL